MLDRFEGLIVRADRWLVARFAAADLPEEELAALVETIDLAVVHHGLIIAKRNQLRPRLDCSGAASVQ